MSDLKTSESAHEKLGIVLQQMQEMNQWVDELRHIYNDMISVTQGIQLFSKEITIFRLSQNLKTIQLQKSLIEGDLRYFINARRNVFDYLYEELVFSHKNMHQLYLGINKQEEGVLENRMNKMAPKARRSSVILPIPSSDSPAENEKKTPSQHMNECRRIFQDILELNHLIWSKIQRYRSILQELRQTKSEGYGLSKLILDLQSQVEKFTLEKDMILKNLDRIICETFEMNQEILGRMTKITKFWKPNRHVLSDESERGKSSNEVLQERLVVQKDNKHQDSVPASFKGGNPFNNILASLRKLKTSPEHNEDTPNNEPTELFIPITKPLHTKEQTPNVLSTLLKGRKSISKDELPGHSIKSSTPVVTATVEPTPVEPTPVEPTPVEPTPVEPIPVEPIPVEPTPVEPTTVVTASVEPTTVVTASVEPVVVEPVPVEPVVVEPAPVEPVVVEPAPVEPVVVEPVVVEPAVVEPTPVEPAPVEPAVVESAPVEPVVVEPAPVEPAVVEPAVVEPTPVEPAPVEPVIVEPVVVEPAPVEPAVVEPVVVEPAVVEPAPVEPAPVEPAPVESVAVEPASVEPAPVEPAPVEPAPVELAPVEPAPVEPVVTEPVVTEQTGDGNGITSE